MNNPILIASETASISGAPDGNFSVARYYAVSQCKSISDARKTLESMTKPDPEWGEGAVKKHPRNRNTFMPTQSYIGFMACDEEYEKQRSRMTEADRMQEANDAFAGLDED